MNEIKIGDFVRMKHPPFEGQICQITGMPKEGMYLTDRCSLCTDAHFEPIDPKTAFLTELKALMERYNAYIEPCGYEIEGLYIGIDNDNDWGYYKMDEYSPIHKLTPDNIFDYEKE